MYILYAYYNKFKIILIYFLDKETIMRYYRYVIEKLSRLFYYLFCHANFILLLRNPSGRYLNFYAQVFFIISEYPINFRLITAANFSDFSQDPRAVLGAN